MTQNTEQNVRTRDKQIEDAYLNDGDFTLFQEFDRDDFEVQLKEAEARGAAGERAKANGKPIHIVFAGEPGVGTLHFVEVEDGKGNNIRVGEWVKRSGGLMDLVIPARDAANVAALKARVQELEAVLDGINVYSGETLAGPISGQGGISWFRDGVEEVFRRARAALTREGGV